MKEVTHYGFTNSVRPLLHRQGFEHHDLERIQKIFHDSLEKRGADSLKANHLDETLDEMRHHEEWKRLSESQQGAVEKAFTKHLGIEERITPE